MDRLRETFASDIPFARDDAHRLLPLMIACLAGFAALLLAVAITLTSSLRERSHSVAGMLQVEVPAESSQLARVSTSLRNTAGVEKVTVLEQRTMETLLKPWLGEDFNLSDLPVPTIIEVQTKVHGDKTQVNLEALRKELRAIDRNITVQDRGPWVAQTMRAVGLLQALVLLVACLLLACAMAMIVLVSRTNLKLHFKAVSLLHLFGATDEYILRQFQWNSALLAGRGALIGVVFAALVFAGAAVLTHRWDNPMLPMLSFDIWHAILFLALPLFTSLTALLATRLTVQSMLSHMH